MDISVIIPVYNVCVADKVIESFAGQMVPPGYEFEIIVIDDGSTDGTAERIRRVAAHPRVRLFFNAKNEGVAATRNLGLDAARGRLVILSDGDCVPAANFITAHLEFHRLRTAEHFVGLGAVRYPPEIRVTPLMALGNVVEYCQDPGPEGSRDFGLLYTTNMSAKKSFLKERFRDNVFHLSGLEDNELGLRLAAQGMILLAVSEAVSYHYHFLTPVQFQEKAYRYGQLLARWVAISDPSTGQTLNERFNYLYRHRGVFSFKDLRKLAYQAAVNDLTFPLLRFAAHALEPRWETLAAKLYWKMYPYLFLKGYRGEKARGVRDLLPVISSS